MQLPKTPGGILHQFNDVRQNKASKAGACHPHVRCLRNLDAFEAAPLRDEQRRRLGDAPHRLQFDALVEAVDVVRLRSIDQRRDAGVEAEEAVVGGAGRRLVDQRLADT